MKGRRNGSGDYAIKPIAESSENARGKLVFPPQRAEYTEKNLMLLEPCEPVSLYPQFTQVPTSDYFKKN